MRSVIGRRQRGRETRRGGAAAAPERSSQSNVLTFLAPGVRVEGTIVTSAPLRVDGFLKGEIQADGEVTIGESGRVEGPVRGKRILVAGIIEGAVDATGELRILPTGQLIGNVRTPNLVVEEGALFKGMCEMVEEQSAGAAPKAKLGGLADAGGAKGPDPKNGSDPAKGAPAAQAR